MNPSNSFHFFELQIGRIDPVSDWIIIVVIAVLYLYSLGWVYNDAKARGRNSWVAVAFIALGGWPLSIFWWSLLRPAYASIKRVKDSP